jgi:hypothetical protein
MMKLNSFKIKCPYGCKRCQVALDDNAFIVVRDEYPPKACSHLVYLDTVHTSPRIDFWCHPHLRKTRVKYFLDLLLQVLPKNPDWGFQPICDYAIRPLTKDPNSPAGGGAIFASDPRTFGKEARAACARLSNITMAEVNPDVEMTCELLDDLEANGPEGPESNGHE